MKISAKTFVAGTKVRVIEGAYKLCTLPSDWEPIRQLEAYDAELDTADLFSAGTKMYVLYPSNILEVVKLKKEGGQMIYFKDAEGKMYKSFYGLFRALTEIV